MKTDRGKSQVQNTAIVKEVVDKVKSASHWSSGHDASSRILDDLKFMDRSTKRRELQ